MTSGDAAADKAAGLVNDEILQTPWDGVELLPAGASLTGVSQLSIPDTWLLRDILTAAGIYDRYDLLLLDTGGRTGSLVTLAMYAADVAYAPIAPTTDAVRKAGEARNPRRAHPAGPSASLGRCSAVGFRWSRKHRGGHQRQGLRRVRR